MESETPPAPPPDAELSELIREVRARVPVDAAELLATEPPERIEAVLRALPQPVALRIAFALPEALRPAAGDFGSPTETALPGSVEQLMEEPRGVMLGDVTVGGAVEYLKQQSAVSDITYLYVVDATKRLLGLVVMRDLLLAKSDQRLDQLMVRHPFTLRADMPIAEAVLAAVKRHYPVYPAVDASGVLVGLVRGYKLFERQAIEISAQSGSMVGLDKEERVSTGIMAAFKMRHPWLQVNLLTAFLAGFVVSMFEGTITQIVALAAFLPILAGQSGNTGCQALAITLRGLTLGHLETYPLRRVMIKEVLLGALNGALTGLVAGAAMWWSSGGSGNPQALSLAFVILLAMVGSCMASGFFGVLVPLTLKRFGADPSTASSIFLTTGTDIAGMGLMLLLATTLVL